MKYEYDYETIALDDKQKHLLEIGIANVDAINLKIKEIINKRSQDEWEPLYPFSVPMMWFKRPVYDKELFGKNSGKVPNKKKKA